MLKKYNITITISINSLRLKDHGLDATIIKFAEIYYKYAQEVAKIYDY